MWINWNVFEEFWVWICLLCWSHCAQSIQEIVLLHLSPTTYFVGMRTSIIKWAIVRPWEEESCGNGKCLSNETFSNVYALKNSFYFHFQDVNITKSAPVLSCQHPFLLGEQTSYKTIRTILTHFSHRHWHYGLSKLIVYSQIKVIIETAWFFVLACLNQKENVRGKGRKWPKNGPNRIHFKSDGSLSFSL